MATLPVRTTVILAALLGGLVVGSAVLKTRHLVSITDRMQWQPEGFELGRAQLDRSSLEGLTDRGTDALGEVKTGVNDYLRGNDRDALAHLLRARASEADWPLLRFYLGVTRLRLGHAVSAADDLRFATENGFDPPESTSRWWWAMAELYGGNFNEGRTLLTSVAASDSPQADMARQILDRLDTLELEEHS